MLGKGWGCSQEAVGPRPGRLLHREPLQTQGIQSRALGPQQGPATQGTFWLLTVQTPGGWWVRAGVQAKGHPVAGSTVPAVGPLGGASAPHRKVGVLSPVSL